MGGGRKNRFELRCGEKEAEGSVVATTRSRRLAVSNDLRAATAKKAKWISGWTESGVEMPCATTCGSFAGQAFAARTSQPAPPSGEYHASFASNANANTSKHMQIARTLSLNGREAKTPDIGAV